jgi:hypothetical protein
MKTRISKKSLAAFPATIAETIKTSHSTIKSFQYLEKTEGQEFFFDEGDKVTCFYGDRQVDVEVVSENTVGGANYHCIGAKIQPKAGATIVVRSYMYGYYLTVYNFGSIALAA